MITTLGLVSRSRIETIVTWCGITFKRRLNWKKDDLFLKKHYLDLFLKKHDCLKCYLTKCSLLWSVCQRGSKFQNVWISFLILFVFCSEFCANPCSCFTTQSSVDIITIWEQLISKWFWRISAKFTSRFFSYRTSQYFIYSPILKIVFKKAWSCSDGATASGHVCTERTGE